MTLSITTRSWRTFTVGPRSALRTVTAEMAEHKYGCAIIVEKDEVVGVFTTVDACRALSTLLEELRARK